MSAVIRRNRLMRRVRQTGYALLAVALLLPMLAAAGTIELRTGFTEQVDGVHYLNADVRYSLSEDALDALENGLPLDLSIDIEVLRKRGWWPDATEIEFTQTYRVQFQPLTQLYLIENLSSGRRQSFQSYGAAMAYLGQIQDLPVIDDDRLDPGSRYDIRIRVRLDIKEHPAGLGLVARIWSNSRISSGWYQWTLRS
jgi:hypothetical protein